MRAANVDFVVSQSIGVTAILLYFAQKGFGVQLADSLAESGPYPMLLGLMFGYAARRSTLLGLMFGWAARRPLNQTEMVREPSVGLRIDMVSAPSGIRRFIRGS